MNLDSLSFTLSQISYLVASLTKKKYKQVAEELGEVGFFLCNESLDVLTELMMTNRCIGHFVF